MTGTLRSMMVTSSVGAGGVERRYREALAALAAGTGKVLTPALLTALQNLNAVFYLRQYLPLREHAAAVYAAARRIEALSTARYYGPDAEAGATGAAADAVDPRRRALRLATRFAELPEATVAVQHVLELAPIVDARGRNTLLTALEPLLEAQAQENEAAAATEPDRAPVAQQLDCWARANARPPREGETVRWAAYVATGPASRILEQALASGLAFSGLLDALNAAATLWLWRRPAAAAVTAVLEAHAVRRLCELTAAAPLEAWLVVAEKLAGNRLRPRDLPVDAPVAGVLARAALASTLPPAVRVAEAALVESETLPPDLRALPRAALAAYLATESSQLENDR